MKSIKSRYWAFVVYPESTPYNFRDILEDYHVPMAISPLHDKDLNSDNVVKKSHYHVLIAYGNTTTDSNINAISASVNGTIAIPVMSLKGYYRYLTHKDNPEKAQYKESDIVHLAGFDPYDYWNFNSEESVRYRLDIMDLMKKERIYNYFSLLEYLSGYDLILFKYASDNTILVKALCQEYKYLLRVDSK